MALSTRGQAQSKTGPGMTIWKVIQDLWDPTSNPTGYVSLGVAENSLMHSELTEYINTHTQMVETGLTYGDGGAGRRECRSTMARFLNRRFSPAVPVESSHICMTNGVSTGIEHLADLLADPGDAFLLGQPFYGAFIPDIELRPGVEVVKVPFGNADPLSLESVSSYASAIESCQAKGQRVAGLMLCNPHNPLGRCYPRSYIIELMKLCNKHRIHLVSDEIYALSVFQESDVPFTSLLSIPTDGVIDPALTHVLYGISKDFGANGLRVGAIISQHNRTLHDALIPVAIYTYMSSLVESLATKLLSDDKWIDWYVAENHRRLKKNYDIVTDWAERHNVMYKKGVCAAFFLWVNFGPHYERKMAGNLPNISSLNVNEKANGPVEPHSAGNPEVVINGNQQGETAVDVDAKIQDALLGEKVFLASGTVFGGEEPGWVRIVFSQNEKILREGLRRVERALGLSDSQNEKARL